MAYKTFVVERTEDESTQTAGAATLNRADVPPLVKVFDDESDIVLSTLSTNEIVATENTDYSAVAVVDRVAEGNLNPVTSNAVAEAISPIAMPINVIDKVTLSNPSHYKCIYAVYYETETEWFFDVKTRGDGGDYITSYTVDLSAFLTSTAAITAKNFLIFNGGSTSNVRFSNESLTDGVLSFAADTYSGGSTKARWCEYIYWGTK